MCIRDRFWSAHSKNKPNGAQFFSPLFKNLIDLMIAYDPNQRASLAEIKAHPWYNGPVPTHLEIIEEFTKRNEIVNQENQKAKQKKEQEKARPKLSNVNMIGGHTAVYRDQHDVDTRADQLGEVTKRYPNIKLERKVSFYTPIVAKCGHQILVPETLQETFENIIIKSTITRDYELGLDDKAYKLTLKKVTESDTLEIKVKVMKVDEDTSCVQLKRQQGPHFQFLECVNQIRNLLFEIEEQKAEST
eukprot:TRINITY_DN652_c0_g1_i9.p1 TRINITY_DN652_c0_g1~~TRINITY_DN652_c0_g1_i9.p1  ORF type:complete len:246 (-),score=51.95 TRINITY_DN652_c0_g1_i9:34-771(-)